MNNFGRQFCKLPIFKVGIGCAKINHPVGQAPDASARANTAIGYLCPVFSEYCLKTML
jgi:hypothetical protein